VALAIVGAPASMAWGQEVAPSAAPAAAGEVGVRQEGTGGVMIGEGVYLNVGVTAEAGYDSNVFYNDVQPIDSGTIQVTPFAEITNSAREEVQPPVKYSIGASLLYREYLTGDEQVRAQRAFNPSFSGSLAYSSAGQSLSISDEFTRLQDPPYQPGDSPITRDFNVGIVQAGLAPGGGRIQVTPRYTNTLDIFEGDDFSYGNRMAHEGMIDASWRWLPKTAVFLQGSVGYIQYLSSEAESAGKSNSIPYRAVTGIRGLVTPKLTLVVGVGYADASYDQAGVNPSGASNLSANVGLTFNATELTTFGASYSHEFRDSPVLGNYYDLDAADLAIRQRLGPVTLGAAGRYEHRRYHGFQMGAPIGRTDNIFQTRVQADYQLQRWFYAGASYTNMISRSDDNGAPSALVPQADYTKHVVLGRLGVTY
jgi:hypothetical protein